MNSLPLASVVTLMATTALASDTNPYAAISEIPLPAGYSRVKTEKNSFGEWLRQRPLKTDKTVYLFDGTEKQNQAAQFAVLDVSVGERDLQQCADAVMRLRAEYLFAQKRYAEISFTDNAKKKYALKEPFTRAAFDQYLIRVFSMCGSASLEKQLKKPAAGSHVEPGDVLIRGGFPGHAVIVVDVAVNAEGQRAYLLAQSYMPAQDIHILVNPADDDLSPWYAEKTTGDIETPEYTFHASEFKRW